MALTPKITVDGIDVTSYLLNYETDETKENEPSVMAISFLNTIQNDISLTQEMEVIVTQGFTTSTDHTIFKGSVSNIIKSGNIIKAEVKDPLWKLQRITVTTSYESNDSFAGKISAIAEDLIQTYGGLSATVVDSGTVRIREQFICRNDFLLERLKRLAEILKWIVYYSPIDDTIHFESPGTQVYSSGDLEVGTQIRNVPEWEYDFDGVVNKVTVKGALQEVETTDSGQIGVTSGFTTVQIPLTYEPVSVKVFVDSSNPPTTLRTGGNLNSTESFDYYVDKLNKKIVFSSTYTPGSSDYVEVQYSYLEPRNVTSLNQASIDAYGVYETVVKEKDTLTVTDAKEKARGIVAVRPNPLVRTELEVVGVTGTVAGMKIQVVDLANNEDREVIIRRLRRRYPEGIDIYEVGDREVRIREQLENVNERLRALEKENERNQGLLVQVFEQERPLVFKRRYQECTKYKIFDSFTVDHPINGLFGQGQILDNFTSSNSSNWSGSGVTIGDEASTVQVGSGSMSVVWSASSGDVTISSTQSLGDISTETGQSSGTPSQGTIGIWLNSPSTTLFSSLTLRIGSGASDYAEYSAREYRTVDGYQNWGSLTFGLYTGWNYFLFDLDNPDNVVGTPDWTAVDYVDFIFGSVDSADTVYLDYFTINKGNYIGLNGLGDRNISIGQLYIQQGERTFREYCFDSKFFSEADSTASLDITNKKVVF